MIVSHFPSPVSLQSLPVHMDKGAMAGASGTPSKRNDNDATEYIYDARIPYEGSRVFPEGYGTIPTRCRERWVKERTKLATIAGAGPSPFGPLSSSQNIVNRHTLDERLMYRSHPTPWRKSKQASS